MILLTCFQALYPYNPFMKNLRLITAAFTFFWVLASTASASPVQDEDTGFWLLTDLEHKQGPWSFRAGEDTRFREHSGIYYYDTHIGAGRKLTSYFTAGAEYLQVRQTKSSGRKEVWFWEERPRVYGTLSETLKGFKFENRHMMEFRFKEEAENTMRYRTQFSGTAPWKLTRFEFQPFASAELFFETNRNGLIEVRYLEGFKFQLTKRLGGSLYYMREPTKNSQAKWKDLNIFGASVKITV